MPKTRFQCQSTALVTTLLTWMSETNKSPQPCEQFLVKFWKLTIFFFYTARALTWQNNVAWCYEKMIYIYIKHVKLSFIK